MKKFLFLFFLFFVTSLHAQGYALVDTSGHIIKQFYYNGTDSLPARAHSLAGLTDIQLAYKGQLTWKDSAWLYSGPDTLPVAPPDPNAARRIALQAAGFTDAQIDALIGIFNP